MLAIFRGDRNRKLVRNGYGRHVRHPWEMFGHFVKVSHSARALTSRHRIAGRSRCLGGTEHSVHGRRGRTICDLASCVAATNRLVGRSDALEHPQQDVIGICNRQYIIIKRPGVTSNSSGIWVPQNHNF